MPAKVFGKLKSWTRNDRDDNQLVRANLSGSGLPPEMQEGGASTRSPCCSDAETAAIASIHPAFQEEKVLQIPEPHTGVVTRGPDGKFSLYDTLLSRQNDDQSAYQDQHPRAEPSIADSLKHREGSGHGNIQNLAEHYKGRSRRLAAARELTKASTSKDRADIILEHQLMDIDTI